MKKKWSLKTSKEDINDAQKPDRFIMFIFVVCNMWYNAWEEHLLDKKLWFCLDLSFTSSFVNVNFFSA